MLVSEANARVRASVVLVQEGTAHVSLDLKSLETIPVAVADIAREAEVPESTVNGSRFEVSRGVNERGELVLSGWTLAD